MRRRKAPGACVGGRVTRGLLAAMLACGLLTACGRAPSALESPAMRRVLSVYAPGVSLDAHLAGVRRGATPRADRSGAGSSIVLPPAPAADRLTELILTVEHPRSGPGPGSRISALRFGSDSAGAYAAGLAVERRLRRLLGEPSRQGCHAGVDQTSHVLVWRPRGGGMLVLFRPTHAVQPPGAHPSTTLFVHPRRRWMSALVDDYRDATCFVA